jgi:hypothetical protein
VELPELSKGVFPPSFSFVSTLLTKETSRTESAEGLLGFDVRNEGPEVSDPISHIYPFAEQHVSVSLKPVQLADKELGEMQATDADKALLRLPVHYRIPRSLSAIPPGAIERLSCFYREIDSVMESVKFCLRLHTKDSMLNFPFRLDFTF